jgi:hypothetical protein
MHLRFYSGCWACGLTPAYSFRDERRVMARFNNGNSHAFPTAALLTFTGIPVALFAFTRAPWLRL